MLNLCVPAAVGASLPQGWQSARRDPRLLESRRARAKPPACQGAADGRLRTELAAGDILALRPGDVMSLGRSGREPIEVRAWTTVKLLAQPTRTANGFGLTVHSWVGTAEEGATR